MGSNMEVRIIFPHPAHANRLLRVCNERGIAVGTAIRVAMEWHGAQTGAPLPQPGRRHTVLKPVTPESVRKHGAVLRVPESWVEHVGRDFDKIRKRAIAATLAWLDAGAPDDHIRRACIGATVGHVPGDAERLLQVHVRLHGAEKLVRADAMAAKVNASAICRRIVAAAYQQQTGSTLPSCKPRSWTVGAPSGVDGLPTFNVGMPPSWVEAIGALCRGDVTQWVRDAVLRHYKVDELAAVAKKGGPHGQPVNRLPELVAQSKDQSIWPSGLSAQDVRVSITGRPYVSKTARDERAEGVAA